MIYAILLSYYPRYLKTASEEFSLLLKKLHGDHAKVLVANCDINLINGKADNYRVISGDNTNWEFTGWDVALREIENFEDSDIFVFANDTFCHHRPWGRIERFFFSRAINRLMAHRNGIAGERNALEKSSTIFGITTTEWVSTYLFAISGNLIRQMHSKVSLSEDQLTAAVPGVGDAEIVFSPLILGSNLRTHIQNWIFPKNSSTGWYKSQSSSKSLILRKIKAIVNEKYITAFCIQSGGRLFDSRTPPPVRMARKVIKKIRPRHQAY